jgi:hypothetical protein
MSEGAKHGIERKVDRHEVVHRQAGTKLVAIGKSVGASSR